MHGDYIMVHSHSSSNCCGCSFLVICALCSYRLLYMMKLLTISKCMCILSVGTKTLCSNT